MGKTYKKKANATNDGRGKYKYSGTRMLAPVQKQITSLKRSVRKINKSSETKYIVKYSNDFVANSYNTTASQPRFYNIGLLSVPTQGTAKNAIVGSEYTVTSIKWRMQLRLIPDETTGYVEQFVRVVVYRLNDFTPLSDGVLSPSTKTSPLQFSNSIAILSNQVDYIGSSYNVDYRNNIKVLYDKTLFIGNITPMKMLKFKHKLHKTYEIGDETNVNNLIYIAIFTDYTMSKPGDASVSLKYSLESKMSFKDD